MAHAALQDLLTAKTKVAAEYKKRGTKFFCGDSPGSESIFYDECFSCFGGIYTFICFEGKFKSLISLFILYRKLISFLFKFFLPPNSAINPLKFVGWLIYQENS